MKKIMAFCMLGMFTIALVSAGIIQKNQIITQDKKLGLPDNAVEVSPGVFYIGKSINKGKVVDGYIFVHYAKNSAKVNNNAKLVDDTFNKYKFLIPQADLKWIDTVTYEANIEGCEWDFDATDILQKSLKTWNNEITGFILFDENIINSEVLYGSNGINSITCTNFGSGTIAMITVWYDIANEEIVESDVQFNIYYDWSTDETLNTMDLQNIATHEFGHNGLADLYMRPAKELTMYGYSGYGDIKKRTLGTGDISGIQALYNL